MKNLFQFDYEIQDFEYDQDTFNLIAGTANLTDRVGLTNQLLLIKEEMDEIAQGLRNSDKVEVLDGAVDTLFVVLGFMQKLKMAGFKTYEALQLVAENNLSKFPKDYDTVLDTIEYYKEQGIECHWEFNEDAKRFVIRDSNNKVRKPVGYRSVDLTSCVPSDSDYEI